MSLRGRASVTQILMISMAALNGLFREVVTTILFEFGFGHYLRGFSRSQLMRDDNVRAVACASWCCGLSGSRRSS